MYSAVQALQSLLPVQGHGDCAVAGLSPGLVPSLLLLLLLLLLLWRGAMPRVVSIRHVNYKNSTVQTNTQTAHTLVQPSRVNQHSPSSISPPPHPPSVYSTSPPSIPPPPVPESARSHCYNQRLPSDTEAHAATMPRATRGTGTNKNKSA